jgi:phage pi2 protein 07
VKKSVSIENVINVHYPTNIEREQWDFDAFALPRRLKKYLEVFL